MLSAQGVRAQQVLSALDSAKEEREQNMCLRNQLLDGEDLLEELHHQLFSQKFHRELALARSQCNSLLLRYEKELSYAATTKKHNINRYMEDCGLKVPLFALPLEDIPGNARSVRYLETNLVQGFKDSKAPLVAEAGAFFERLDLLVSRSIKLCDTAKIDSASWLPTLEPLVELLVNMLNARPLEEPLRPITHEIERLSKIDEGLVAKQQKSGEEGDIGANEEIMQQRVTLMEALSDLVTQQFHLMDGEQFGFISNLRKKLVQVQDATTEFIKSVKAKQQTRRCALEEDMQHLHVHQERAAKDEQLARQGFFQEKCRSDDLLQRNSDEQEKIWREIFELENKLQKLALERRVEVDKKVKMLEREERRHIDMIHFTEFAESHTQLLEKAMQSCDGDELLTSMITEITQGGFSAVKAVMDSIEQKIETLRMDALGQHLGHFRIQYLALGELLFKKERQLDELEQRAVFAQTQQELAMDSFNPAAREFALQREDIEERTKQLKREIEELRQKAELYVAAFKPTEKAFLAAGKRFEHPVQELQRLNKEKRKKFAEFHALEVTMRKIGSVDVSKGTLMEDAALVDAEKIAFKRLRKSTQRSDHRHASCVDGCLNATTEPLLQLASEGSQDKDPPKVAPHGL